MFIQNMQICLEEPFFQMHIILFVFVLELWQGYAAMSCDHGVARFLCLFIVLYYCKFLTIAYCLMDVVFRHLPKKYGIRQYTAGKSTSCIHGKLGKVSANL